MQCGPRPLERSVYQANAPGHASMHRSMHRSRPPLHAPLHVRTPQVLQRLLLKVERRVAEDVVP